MSTTLNNILGVGNKPVAPYTPPGIDSSLPVAAPVQQQQGTKETPAANGGMAISREEAKGISPVQATPEQKKPQPAEPQEPKRMSYEEMFRKLNPYKPPTQEELEKERKKQKREQIFAAIGDGISALSNLFFTTQYAPNMYSGRNTASQRTRERWDRLAAERNANMTAYINGLMRARQADDAYNDNERAWARQLGLDKVKAERDKAADARAEAKEQRDQEMHDLNKQLMNNQITQAEYEAKKAEVEARYAPQLEESKIGRNRAASGASNASASASRARARYYDNGGSSGNRYYGEFQGKTYKTQADYEKAVLDAARSEGVETYEEVEETDSYGLTSRKRKKRSIADIAAEVDAKDREKKPNPMGDGGNGKKPNPMS